MTDLKEVAERALNEFIECVKRGSADPSADAALASSYREFRLSLESALLPDDSPLHSEVRKGAQSKQFMMQIAPFVQEYMRRHEKGKIFEILDVGCGTGHGSNLLASLYQTVELGYRARVTAVDIDSAYHRYAKYFCPYVVHKVVDDVRNLDRKFDIVIASHVVEHVENPEEFVISLKRLARGLLIVCAPFDEDPTMLTRGHLNVIDRPMIDRFEPSTVALVESPAWGQFMEPRYKMFIATFNMECEPEYSHATGCTAND